MAKASIEKERARYNAAKNRARMDLLKELRTWLTDSITDLVNLLDSEMEAGNPDGDINSRISTLEDVLEHVESLIEDAKNDEFGY